jgi:Membrane dipeptidase (Peptidase family M19)
VGHTGIARLADAVRAVEIHWRDLRTGLADLWDGAEVEISGWVAPIEVTERCDYFLLVAQPTCCIGCRPSNPTACIEVFAAEPIVPPSRALRLAGRWRRLVDDPAGWHYQLRDARVVDADPSVPISRREMLSAGALAALARRVIGGTGGVVGVWPPSPIFPDLNAYVEGFARMADVVGVDHVGFGSDMLGLSVPSVFDCYHDLPLLAQGLLDHGFPPEETGKILCGNYARVFAATLTYGLRHLTMRSGV